MRPDTPHEEHVNRIMAGCFAVFVVITLAKAMTVLFENAATIFAGLLLVSATAALCYIIGWLLLDHVFSRLSD